MNDPLRAIVVEDDFLLAEMLADALLKLGCDVAGCAGTLDEGVSLINESACDFAVVDLDLNGKPAYPLLERLQARGIPCLMATGAFAEEIPEPYRATMRLTKPYDLRELKHALGVLLPGIEFPRSARERHGSVNVG